MSEAQNGAASEASWTRLRGDPIRDAVPTDVRVGGRVISYREGATARADTTPALGTPTARAPSGSRATSPRCRGNVPAPAVFDRAIAPAGPAATPVTAHRPRELTLTRAVGRV
jgi:hypothetical protein